MVASVGNRVEDELGTDLVAMGPPVAVRRESNIRRPPNSSGLYDVLDLILDKGIVIDAFVRVSLVGIEILTVDLRVVIASVDTYLRYAEGAERLQIYKRADAKKLPDMVNNGMKTQAMKQGAERIKDFVSDGDDDNEGDEDEGGEQKKGLAGALTHSVRHMLKKGVGGILHNIKGDNDDDEHEEDEDRDRGEEEDSDEREPARQSKGSSAGRAKAGSRR